MALQDGTQFLIQQCFIDALWEACHSSLLSKIAGILQQKDRVGPCIGRDLEVSSWTMKSGTCLQNLDLAFSFRPFAA